MVGRSLRIPESTCSEPHNLGGHIKKRLTYSGSLALTLASLFAAVALFSTAVCSQAPDWVNFTCGKNVSALADDGEYLRVGTGGGLARLNKTTDEAIFYNRGNSGLPGCCVYSLVIDAQKQQIQYQIELSKTCAGGGKRYVAELTG